MLRIHFFFQHLTLNYLLFNAGYMMTWSLQTELQCTTCESWRQCARTNIISIISIQSDFFVRLSLVTRLSFLEPVSQSYIPPRLKISPHFSYDGYLSARKWHSVYPAWWGTFHFSGEISTADFLTLLFFGFLMMFSNFLCRWVVTGPNYQKS